MLAISRGLVPSLMRAPARRAMATATATAGSRTAIVTGAGRGIGKAIALRLARDGYSVCVNDVATQRNEAESVAAEIKRQGGRACVSVADVGDAAQVHDMVQLSVRELGPLDTMVANAGIVHVRRAMDTSDADFERLFRVNVTGVQHCFAAAARQLIDQGRCRADRPGKLLAAASVAGFRPMALLGPYSATKFAVRGLIQSYAMELAAHHITSNAYAPGIVGTEMWRLIDAELGRDAGGAAEGEMMDKYVREVIAMRRTSTPEDVAGLVSFLASKDSDYVTGQTQIVDGGIVLT